MLLITSKLPIPCYTNRKERNFPSMVLEVNDAGELLLPAELVQAAPHTQLEADRQGDALVLKPVVPAEPPQRRSILDGWPTFPAGLGDPNMTFRREDIYDDDGR